MHALALSRLLALLLCGEYEQSTPGSPADVVPRPRAWHPAPTSGRGPACSPSSGRRPGARDTSTQSPLGVTSVAAGERSVASRRTRCAAVAGGRSAAVPASAWASPGAAAAEKTCMGIKRMMRWLAAGILACPHGWVQLVSASPAPARGGPAGSGVPAGGPPAQAWVQRRRHTWPVRSPAAWSRCPVQQGPAARRGKVQMYGVAARR